ncbi:WD-repeat protein HUSSY-07 [Loa loa]|uniref:WD-repeat protein HUSSY-07 n=1 Tax=Loa loa TaxID=7209 RepID=A0A1I7W2B8_LOALO|nr:WD-repeat protein HUSSY-07 [Loa loa]EFO25997.1 WD-repeat protein HUSSY-07 [Loa loa]
MDIHSSVDESDRSISVRIFSEDEQELSEAAIVLPLSTTVGQLQILCNQLLDSADDPIPITFRTRDGILIEDSLKGSIPQQKIDVEKSIELLYYPEAVFRVRPVTRCTSSLPGHGEPVISVQFSPNGRELASGSGDATVRFWDLNTETPLHTARGHTNWVLCIAWSPDGKKLASACKNGHICLWNPKTGTQIGKKMTSHKQWINQLVWEPYHKNPHCRHLASAAKDGEIRIWDTVKCEMVRCLTGHTASVTCVKWGGQGLIYTGSQDRTIKVWRADDGVLCRTLAGHAHWVNTLALNVEYALRTSFYNALEQSTVLQDDMAAHQKEALHRYEKAKGTCGELLVSGSDDFTLFFWKPTDEKKPRTRMTGHQQLVNQVMFSPNARYIASASFDKSIKLWCGRTGAFLDTLRGHVQAVYQIAWSADSRLLVSGSADSTLKVWDMHKRGLCMDLPGHGDEVYAVDWSPDGTRVASGGKDKLLKLWRQ